MHRSTKDKCLQEAQDQARQAVIAFAEALVSDWVSLPPPDQDKRLGSLAFQSRHLPDSTRNVIGGLLAKAKILSKKEFLKMASPPKPEPEATPTNGKEPRPCYSAVFPGLVDLVEDDNGEPAFAIAIDDQVEIHKEWIGQGNEPLKPPPTDRIPFSLVPAQMIQGPLEDVDIGELAQELEKAFKDAAVLPSDEHYKLLVLWTLATYMLENTRYFIGLLFLGPPERGKSRLLKALAALCYRAWKTETLNESDIFRFTERVHGTLLLDLYDVMSKLDHTGAIDILLALPEKGTKVARVTKPDAPAFEDTQYFEPFAPCAMALNKAVPQGHPLATRFIQIIPPEARGRNFQDLTPDRILGLRARLLKWRALWLYRPLPQAEKLCDGRLGDTTQILARVAALMPPEYGQALAKLIRGLLAERARNEEESREGRVVRALYSLREQVTDGRLSIRIVTEEINREAESDDPKISSVWVGRVCRTLGIPLSRDRKERFLIWEDDLLIPLFQRYTSPPTPSGKYCHYCHTVTDEAQGLDITEVSPDDSKVTVKTDPKILSPILSPDLTIDNHSAKGASGDSVTVMTVKSGGGGGGYVPSSDSGREEAPRDRESEPDPGYWESLLQSEPPPEPPEGQEETDPELIPIKNLAEQLDLTFTRKSQWTS
ncbi:MAG: hypothetical protein HXY29_13855 [Rhodocyclaceae bacterium]|nr:hypothetical protein [Rhodocyclaceae bacterium]